MPIVVGYIPTHEGRAALARAAQECVVRGTSLIVVNSQRGANPYDGDLAVKFQDELDRVAAMLDEAGVGHEVRQLMRDQDPAEDLIAVAEEVGAEFIVIGLRRRSPLGKLILGSNAQRILLDSACPVLSVKAED